MGGPWVQETAPAGGGCRFIANTGTDNQFAADGGPTDSEQPLNYAELSPLDFTSRAIIDGRNGKSGFILSIICRLAFTRDSPSESVPSSRRRKAIGESRSCRRIPFMGASGP